MRIAICDDSQREQEQPFDIVFLDIYMPGENGVDIAGELQKVSPETGIVFVTSSLEHAVDAFSLQALHYLVKPVTTEGLVEAFRRLTKLHDRQRPMATFSTGRGSSTVYLDEIYYLQSMNHAVDIYLSGGRQLRVWATLTELEQRLNDNFLRLNRSTIVNMEQIEQMCVDSCILRDGSRLELARRDRNRIRSAYEDFLFARLSDRQNLC